MPKEYERAITGDVVEMADVTVNTKGGSMTAILKKPLRQRLGESSGSLSAATMEFETGQAIVLLSGGAGTAEASASVHVRKVGRNRFEVALATGDDEEVGEVTAAFLRLKEAQFKKGTLQLIEPVTANGWRAEVNDMFGAADKAMKETAKGRRRRRAL